MLICVKKVGQDLDFKRVLSPTSEDFKAIIGATTLATRKINENITCLYDFNNLETNKEYNFVLLEEVKCDYDLVDAIKGTVVFIREEIEYYLNNFLSLQLKDNWQVFRFDYLDKKHLDSNGKPKHKGRPLDFMGYKFYCDHIEIRKRTSLESNENITKHIRKL